jgi:phosphate ABC transporter phosphate-binding protein
MSRGERVRASGGWRAVRVMAGLLLVLLAAVRTDGQTVGTLANVKKVYVDRFEEGDEAEPLRQSLIKRLAKSGRYQLADTAQGADAIVKGSGELWLKGYLTVNSRTPASDRQAVYEGYLSVELVNKEGEPLWSYLVTPSKLTFLRVRDDLANNLVKQMIMASERASGQESTSPNASAVVKLAQTELVGAGATFPAPLYRRWFASFQRLHPEVQIRYQEIGSEAGAAALQTATVDFAASDLPATAEEMADGKVQRIASVLGGVVPVYHLEGVDRDLRFTSDALARIYLGRIRRWNDPAIQSLNKDVDLPDTEIVVIHRSDGSGTTYAWSDFLTRTNSEWKTQLGAGTKLNWPVGIGVEGNEKMAAAVQETPNSLGYAELVFAIQHHLSFGSVRNRAGKFVHADLDSLAEAALPVANAADSGAAASILDAPGKNAYPIATFTWLLVPAYKENAEKQAAMELLLEWILVEGQRECSSLGYAPLPREVTNEQMMKLKAKR